MAALQLHGMVKRFGDQTVIHGIDLDIEDGELIVFVGPSGCGKSTLLRMIAGLEDITSGNLAIGGKPANATPPAQRGVAMVFQSYALYPHMTVFDNIAFNLRLAGRNRAQIAAAVQRVADILQIGPLLQRKPNALSGGQRQRVAIGRAIVREPAVFLFDEPLSNLDATLRLQMRIELRLLHQRLQTTMIYVTHDQVEAMTLGQRIVVFNGGRIEQVGTPQALYEEPANLFVAGFLGAPKMNFIVAEVAGISDNDVAVRLPDGTVLSCAVDAGGARVGDAVTLGIRPEQLRLSADRHDAEASVAQVDYLGGATTVHVRLPGCDSLIALHGVADIGPLHPGQLVRLALQRAQCHLFDQSGRVCAPRARVH